MTCQEHTWVRYTADPKKKMFNIGDCYESLIFHLVSKSWFLCVDFAENRLKLAEILYFKILENIMTQEMKRLQGKDMAVSQCNG